MTGSGFARGWPLQKPLNHSTYACLSTTMLPTSKCNAAGLLASCCLRPASNRSQSPVFFGATSRQERENQRR
jgi:hypothetical protein